MKIVIILMIPLLLFTGCATTTTIPPLVTPEDELVTRFIPVADVPKIYIDRTIGNDGVFPPEIKIGGVNYGDELSTWTGNIPELGINNGEPLALYIFNRTGEEVAYNISVSTPDKNLRDDDGNEYTPSIAAIFWVELSDNYVIVPPETVVAISVRIRVPNKTSEFSLYNRWSFQLLISPVQSGSVQRAYLQNWLIGMK